MKFSNAKQVVVMTVLSALLLCGIDWAKNPWVFAGHKPPPNPGSVHVTLMFNHLCCTGCLGVIDNALAPIGWIQADHQALDALKGVQVRSRDVAKAMKNPLADYGNQITLPINDIKKVDFMDLDRATRAKGLVIARMLLGGVPHFHFVVDMGHMCCSLCETADKTGLDYAKALTSTGNLSWVDSMDTTLIGPGLKDGEGRINIYAKYVPPDSTVDVVDLIRTFNQIGFEPKSIRVDIAPEKMEMK